MYKETWRSYPDYTLHTEDVLARDDSNTVAVHFTATGELRLLERRGCGMVCMCACLPGSSSLCMRHCTRGASPFHLTTQRHAAGAGTCFGEWRGHPASGRRSTFSGGLQGMPACRYFWSRPVATFGVHVCAHPMCSDVKCFFLFCRGQLVCV